MRLLSPAIPLLILLIFAATSSAGTVTQTYMFDAPRVETVDGRVSIIMAGTQNEGVIGEPLLPHAPLKLLLPPGEEVASITVKTADPVVVGTGYRIPHRLQPLPLSAGQPVELTPPNEAVYRSNDPYPAERHGEISTQYLAGHGIALGAIYPVTYRPQSGELAYYPWLEVTVHTQPTLRSQTAFGTMLKRSSAVQERIVNLVQNAALLSRYGAPDQTDDIAWDMLLITLADFVDDYQDFVDYKNRSGIRTTVETVQDIYLNYSGTDQQDKIRNCIIDYYQNSDIRYVYLCGDHNQVLDRGLMCMEEAIPADLYYAGLDGTWNDDGDDRWGEVGEEDLLAEVFVGRSTGDNVTEIANIVNKMLLYQTDPVVDELETALMVGEDLGWEIWAWEYKEEIRLGTSTYAYQSAAIPTYFEVDTLYDRPGYTWDAMTDLLPRLNEGPGLINHLGHANEENVLKFSLGNVNDDNFTNDGVNHNFWIGYSQGCLAGAFDYQYGDCIVEVLTGIAHGPVAFVANSRFGYGDYHTTDGPSQYYDRQFFDALFGENITYIGETNQDSKEDNAWLADGDNCYRWCYYELNLFSDPTLDVWTAEPGQFNPSYAPAVVVGSQSFEVTDISVPGALVTISVDNQVIGQGCADPSGTAVVIFDSILMVLGDLDLMITAHDMLPYEGPLVAVSPSGPFIIFNACSVEDGTTGNGNGQLDYNETVELDLTVENLGLSEATNVNLTIRCDDPLLTIDDSTAFLGNLTAGTTGTVQSGFTITASPDVPDGYTLDFRLIASDGDTTWETPFSVPAHAPILYYEGLTISETGGNLDDQLEPGETGCFDIAVHNSGSAGAPDVSLGLSCSHPLITVPAASPGVSVIAPGVSETIRYDGISADPDMQQGESVEFTLTIEADGDYTVVETFEITVGDIRYAPSGPDQYGYYAFDIYDGAGAVEYDWREIAPAAGGGGTDLQMIDNQVVRVDLPFDFGFYGGTYDQISICSHGWISFDPVSMFYPMNRPIPDLVQPNNMVACFWDELTPAAAGQVCTYYEPRYSRFIIEWYGVPHMGNPDDLETFEIFLYDPAVCASLAGDGDIVLQYRSVSTANGCTVGIENGDGTVGLELVCDDEYDESAIPLQDGYVVRFSTTETLVGVEPAVTIELPKEYALEQNYPNPFNPVTAITYALPRASQVRLSVFNIAGQLVGRLVDGKREAGFHTIRWDATQLSSGLYFCRIDTEGYRAVRKMMLIK